MDTSSALRTSIPAAAFGATVTVPTALYRPLVAMVLVAAAVRLFGLRQQRDEALRNERPMPIAAALGVGAALGLLAGLTGTGGGVFLTPALILTGWATPRRAAGLSAAFILVNSAAGILAASSALVALPSELPLGLAAVAVGGAIGAELGAPDSLAQLTLSGMLLGGAVGQLVIGPLSDRYGRKPVLIAGWIIGLPVPLLLMWAPTWGWVIAANVLLGVNQGLTWSTTIIMKIDLVGPERRGLAMGLNEAAGYGAVAVSADATATTTGGSESCAMPVAGMLIHPLSAHPLSARAALHALGWRRGYRHRCARY